MFIWDAENTAHIARHNISREEAEQVIQNDPLDLDRQITTARSALSTLARHWRGGFYSFIVTERDDQLRVVTAFPADKKSRKFYLLKKDAVNAKGSKDP